MPVVVMVVMVVLVLRQPMWSRRMALRLLLQRRQARRRAAVPGAACFVRPPPWPDGSVCVGGVGVVSAVSVVSMVWLVGQTGWTHGTQLLDSDAFIVVVQSPSVAAGLFKQKLNQARPPGPGASAIGSLTPYSCRPIWHHITTHTSGLDDAQMPPWRAAATEMDRSQRVIV